MSLMARTAVEGSLWASASGEAAMEYWQALEAYWYIRDGALFTVYMSSWYNAIHTLSLRHITTHMSIRLSVPSGNKKFSITVLAQYCDIGLSSRQLVVRNGVFISDFYHDTG
jgi:hypothetical protein